MKLSNLYLQVVVVTLNYRLGLLGFLRTGLQVIMSVVMMMVMMVVMVVVVMMVVVMIVLVMMLVIMMIEINNNACSV